MMAQFNAVSRLAIKLGLRLPPDFPLNEAAYVVAEYRRVAELMPSAEKREFLIAIAFELEQAIHRRMARRP